MIDVGFWEMAMIGIMALVILGPERLPKVARTAGLWVGKARGMMREIKADVKSEMDSADVESLKNIGKDIREASNAFKSEVDSADESTKEKLSDVDNAIADALNKPFPAVKSKKSSQKKTTTKKKSSKKKASKKKASKKKTTTNKASSQAKNKPTNKAQS